MEITLEQYLENRKACAHCEETGNQEVCVTTLLSRADTCIIYNALHADDDARNDDDIKLLQKLRSTHREESVLSYYIRSAKIIKDISHIDLPLNTIWLDILEKHVKPIIELLKQDKLDDATASIEAMLTELENGASI